jgi:hypothetical protein
MITKKGFSSIIGDEYRGQGGFSQLKTSHHEINNVGIL